VTKSANRKFLIDVDSNKYVDYWMGHWSLILGHTQKKIASQIKKQLSYDWMHGTLNKNSIELSDKISKAVPVRKKLDMHQLEQRLLCMQLGLLEQ